jgi:hypothetical protein
LSTFPAQAYLIPQEPGVLNTPLLTSSAIRVQPDGTFTASNVQAGTYDLIAVGNGTGTNQDRPKAWATVQVDQKDITGVRLVIQPGAKLTGQIIYNDSRQARISFGKSLQLIAIGAPIDTAAQGLLTQTAVMDAGGTFSISNVSAGVYRFVIQNMPNQYVTDVRMGGVSVIKDGIRIANETSVDGIFITVDGAGTLGVSVINPQGIPQPGTAVVFIPDLQRQGDGTLYRTASSDASGRFTFSGVAPGVYRVLAFQEFSADAFRNARLLEKYAISAQQVTVPANSGAEVTVTLIPESIH